MLTKRQQEALIAMRGGWAMWPSCLFVGLLGTTFGTGYHAYMTSYVLMDKGLMAFHGHLVYLTPIGEQLAAIQAKLPAPLTKRQWEILLRFRDVGSDLSTTRTTSFRSNSH